MTTPSYSVPSAATVLAPKKGLRDRAFARTNHTTRDQLSYGGGEVDMKAIERLETKGKDMNERRKR